MKKTPTTLSITKPMAYIGTFAAFTGVVSFILFWNAQSITSMIPRPSDAFPFEAFGNIFGISSLVAWVIFLLITIVRSLRK